MVGTGFKPAPTILRTWPDQFCRGTPVWVPCSFKEMQVVIGTLAATQGRPYRSGLK